MQAWSLSCTAFRSSLMCWLRDTPDSVDLGSSKTDLKTRYKSRGLLFTDESLFERICASAPSKLSCFFTVFVIRCLSSGWDQKCHGDGVSAGKRKETRKGAGDPLTSLAMTSSPSLLTLSHKGSAASVLMWLNSTVTTGVCLLR